MGIAPTAVDNERSFSVAGPVCSLRQSLLKVSTLSKLVHISLNTRKDGVFEDFEASDAKFCKELEEFGETGIVSDEDLGEELREGNEPTDSDAD